MNLNEVIDKQANKIAKSRIGMIAPRGQGPIDVDRVMYVADVISDCFGISFIDVYDILLEKTKSLYLKYEDDYRSGCLCV